jgi:uncharacterized protein
MRYAAPIVVAAALFTAVSMSATPPQTRERKHVLAWADVRNGYQHESISHALATIERLGRESGAYDTYIRTDSQPITKTSISFQTGTGIATGEQFLAHNLDFYDAIFFFGVREIDLTPQQKADLLSFVRDDGKGFVAAHSGSTAFFSWPEFGEMLGGRFDEHPWEITSATVVVDDPVFPAMKGFPLMSVRVDEHYQLKGFSRDQVRVLAHLDPSTLDLTRPLVHRKDGDFPVAWARRFGKGRVFYSTLGHIVESWDDPVLQQMYFNALRWSMGLVPGDASPRGMAQAPSAPAEIRPLTDEESSGLPPGEGRDAVAAMCVPCHGVLPAIVNRKTTLGWRATVDDMRVKGAKGTDEQASAAVAYLSAHFAAVDVNTATAEEIASIAGFTPEEAAAIVAYRQGAHAVKSYTDLRKIPGLDPTRLAAAKPRIVYAPK